MNNQLHIPSSDIPIAPQGPTYDPVCLALILSRNGYQSLVEHLPSEPLQVCNVYVAAPEAGPAAVVPLSFAINCIALTFKNKMALWRKRDVRETVFLPTAFWEIIRSLFPMVNFQCTAAFDTYTLQDVRLLEPLFGKAWSVQDVKMCIGTRLKVMPVPNGHPLLVNRSSAAASLSLRDISTGEPLPLPAGIQRRQKKQRRYVEGSVNWMPFFLDPAYFWLVMLFTTDPRGTLSLLSSCRALFNYSLDDMVWMQLYLTRWDYPEQAVLDRVEETSWLDMYVRRSDRMYNGFARAIPNITVKFHRVRQQITISFGFNVYNPQGVMI